MIAMEFFGQGELDKLIAGLSQLARQFSQGVTSLFGRILAANGLHKVPGGTQAFGEHTDLMHDLFVFQSLGLIELCKALFGQLDADVGKGGHSFN